MKTLCISNMLITRKIQIDIVLLLCTKFILFENIVQSLYNVSVYFMLCMYYVCIFIIRDMIWHAIYQNHEMYENFFIRNLIWRDHLMIKHKPYNFLWCGIFTTWWQPTRSPMHVLKKKLIQTLFWELLIKKNIVSFI